MTHVQPRAWITLIALLPVALCGASAIMARPAEQTLRLETKIPLGPVGGRIDHLALDVARHRLFVAELGNNSVGVVDLAARNVVHRITGLKQPQGLAYAPATDTLYVANRGDGSLRMFSGADYTLIGRVELDSDADNVRIDGAAGRIIVGYGDGALAAIDMASRQKIASMALKGHPEGFQLDPRSSDVFVNLPDDRALVVVDRATGRTRHRWTVPYGGNFAMTLDNARERVISVFREPARLVAFSKQSGSVVDQADTCGDVDDVFLDARRDRFYISCGEGFLDIRDAAAAGFPQLERLATANGARTALFAPEIDRLFLAVRSQGNTAAAIWVYAPSSGDAPTR